MIETSIVTADLIFLNFSKEKCGPPHPCPFYKIVLSKVKCIKWKLLKINCIKTKEDNNQLQKLGPFSVISTLLMIICLLIVNSEMHFVQLVFPKNSEQVNLKPKPMKVRYWKNILCSSYIWIENYKLWLYSLYLMRQLQRVVSESTC